MESKWKRDILPYLPERLRGFLSGEDSLQEIRLRAGRALTVRDSRGERAVSGEAISHDEISAVFEALCEHSVYSRQEEVRMGYLTMRGGHRVGICGHVVTEGAGISLIRDISSLNIRVAREIIGCADKVMRHIVSCGVVKNTLIISGPGMGKTTLLRDIARNLASELSVGIIDERSEIAACYKGISQLDVGERTDVLDACPKALGFSMMLRAMAPRVIVTDEIGRAEDVSAIEDALGAGVSVITSAHGRSIAELERRPALKEIIGRRYFQRYLVLGGRVGSLEQVYNGEKKPIQG